MSNQGGSFSFVTARFWAIKAEKEQDLRQKSLRIRFKKQLLIDDLCQLSYKNLYLDIQNFHFPIELTRDFKKCVL